MRTALVAAALVLQATVQSSVPMAPASTPVSPISPRQPTFVPCVVSDGAPSGERCRNLLKNRWSKGNPSSADVKAILDSLAIMTAQPEVDNQFRVADRACRGTNDPEYKKFRVTLTVPAEMLRYPRTGTQGRELVSAVFLADPDEGCPEARYRHRTPRKKDSDDWEIVAQFTTIASRSVAGAGRIDIQIGDWESWSISQKVSQNSNGTTEYRLNPRLSKGKLWLCREDAPHAHKVAYLRCDESYLLQLGVRLHRFPRIDTFAQALNAFREGDALVRGFVRDSSARYLTGRTPDAAVTGMRDVTDSPAWMRCGDLGCCAMY